MCLSLVGLVAHIYTHPVQKSLYFWWASPVSLFSLLFLPFLFFNRATVRWGYMLNWFTVGIGTITMSYFSLLTLEPPYTLLRFATESTLPKIVFLWMKIPIGAAILKKIRAPLSKTEGGKS
jgi:hypothetical protein